VGRPRRDPILARLKLTGDYEGYLQEFGLVPELPPAADLKERDLPANPETGRKMDLETFAGALHTGLITVNGVHRQSQGGAVARQDYFEQEPSPEWKRSAEFLRLIATMLLSRRNNSRKQRCDLKELRDRITELPPDAILPRFPAELGNPQEFYDNWSKGYVDIALRYRDRSEQGQEIIICWTGLREFEESYPEEPGDFNSTT
jgi:hypothetical protein